jgi:hypothetical protein
MSKTKEERVREGITILQKLREVGIVDNNPGVVAVKDAIRTWIADGNAVTLKRIDFGYFDRVGTLILPSKAGVEPSLTLKVRG